MLLLWVGISILKSGLDVREKVVPLEQQSAAWHCGGLSDRDRIPATYTKRSSRHG